MIGRSGMHIAWAAVVTFLLVAARVEAAELILSETEIERIVTHGPWPQPRVPDPSNRVSGDSNAVSLGRKLFFDTRLSTTGTVSCASCHQPDKGWTDGRARATGITRIDRNTLTLYNVAGQRWFGLDGRTDSLWAHSITPILDGREMGADASHVARLLAGDTTLADAYRAVFHTTPDPTDAQAMLVNAAKALASFQETITSGRTAFDTFRDALATGDRVSAARYPRKAQRGAALFFGRGKCHFCHSGAAFTNGEFADAGVPYFIAPGRVDSGRHGGIAKLRASPYNLTGRFNDDSTRSGAWASERLADLNSNFGAFKVPSLRNLTRTAPYMHDGSFMTLADVVRHYSELDTERLHTDGEKILEPFGFTEAEIEELVAFLETLSD